MCKWFFLQLTNKDDTFKVQIFGNKQSLAYSLTGCLYRFKIMLCFGKVPIGTVSCIWTRRKNQKILWSETNLSFHKTQATSEIPVFNIWKKLVMYLQFIWIKVLWSRQQPEQMECKCAHTHTHNMILIWCCNWMEQLYSTSCSIGNRSIFQAYYISNKPHLSLLLFYTHCVLHQYFFVLLSLYLWKRKSTLDGEYLKWRMY